MAEGKQGAQEAWRAYLELAMGVTDASKKKAQKVAKRLAGRGGATAQQLQALADSLVSTSLANREALTKLVRSEVDRALGAVGLATAEDVADLRARVQDLERQVSSAAAAAADAGGPGQPATATAKKAVAKRAVAKKAVAKASAAGSTPPAKNAVAKRAVAKKTVAKKAGPPAGTGPAGTGPAGVGPE